MEGYGEASKIRSGNIQLKFWIGAGKSRRKTIRKWFTIVLHVK